MMIFVGHAFAITVHFACRELGRTECLKAGCTHFMSMDTDEFYFREQLQAALDLCVSRKLVATSCRMRHYFKTANYEMLPYDEVNQVCCGVLSIRGNTETCALVSF
jgi:hypothetical protein